MIFPTRFARALALAAAPVAVAAAAVPAAAAPNPPTSPRSRRICRASSR